ncbi:hypothetical protein X566_15725 [Afipia sp. P52-10]|jgi:hypothetical protein|uniref:hypothetical protein n=1 Tax=Afipia sp. P52-10 TaxID=1429916 RepID=UPI0003DF2340|nr:hypothetical protein [Afipia sp. P52-10]ETR76033.1 hypothetical protein X566_15725 [Afipia sp. P52-10]
MGMVVEFPAGATQRRLHVAELSSREQMGTVLILPVIRIERHDEKAFDGDGSERGASSGRRRKRRARS